MWVTKGNHQMFCQGGNAVLEKFSLHNKVELLLFLLFYCSYDFDAFLTDFPEVFWLSFHSLMIFKFHTFSFEMKVSSDLMWGCWNYLGNGFELATFSSFTGIFCMDFELIFAFLRWLNFFLVDFGYLFILYHVLIVNELIKMSFQWFRSITFLSSVFYLILICWFYQRHFWQL